MNERGDSFSIDFGGPADPRRRTQENLPALVILADFSARGGTPRAAANASLETLDATMSRIDPQIELETLAGVLEEPTPETLNPTRFDDLHPDTLIDQIAPLRALYAIRQNLRQGDKAAAIDALADWLPQSESIAARASAPVAEPDPPAKHAEDTAEPDADTFARLLGQSATSGGTDREGDKRLTGALQRVLDHALSDQKQGPDEPNPDAIEAALVQVETLLATALRAVLRDPIFQRVVTAWHSVDWLLRQLPDDAAQVTLIDASIETLAQLQAQPGGLVESKLQPLIETACAVSDQALVVGLYRFGRDLDELQVAASLAALAGRHNGYFLAEGRLVGAASLTGCEAGETLDTPSQWSTPSDEGAAFWTELRASALGERLRLCAPPFVLRQPYGPNSDPIERFEFSELTLMPGQGDFCWGNPALAAALALLTGQSQIADMPQPLYDDGGGQALQPSTRWIIGDRTASALRQAGLTPLQANVRLGALAVDPA